MKWFFTALLHLLGAALAATVVALLIGFVAGAAPSRFSFVIFVYAYFFALLVGLPGYFLLRRLSRANWLSVAAVGVGVGLVVVRLFGLWNARIITVEWLYAFPWLAAVANSAVFAMIGSAGALAFWFVVKGLPSSTEEAASRGWHRLAVGIAVALIAGLIHVQAEIAKDKSCHSRDYDPGGVDIASLRLEIAQDEWPSLLTLLNTFGRKYRLSSRSELWRPPQLWDQNFEFSFCRNGLANIYGGIGTDGVYVHFSGSDERALRRLYADLYQRIAAKWPERTTFVREGEPTARPAWLDKAPQGAPHRL